jgi:hypothetical protein
MEDLLAGEVLPIPFFACFTTFCEILLLALWRITDG